MTEYNVPPGAFRDAWVNPGRPSTNFGNTATVKIRGDGARGYVRPSLPNLAGRTVLSATVAGHAWHSRPWAAQDTVLFRVTSRWSEGRITQNNQPDADFDTGSHTITGALPGGSRIEWDVTEHIQAVADGAAWYGWQIRSDEVGDGQWLASANSGHPAWELTIVVSDSPDVPSNLRPDGGAVETSTPVLAWDFVDLEGTSTTQAQSRVQVDTPADGAEPDEVTPDFDSGWVINVDFHYDLATTAHVPTTTSTLETYWRVDVQDADGNPSGWSDWASYTADAKPELVIDSPTGVFGDPTPAIRAHLTAGAVESWRAHVTGPDRSDVRANSGRRSGAEAIDWSVPLRNDGRRVIREGEGGWARVRVWPAGDRAVAVGEHTYVEQWIAMDLDSDLLLAAPTNLSVTQVGNGDPRHVWQWDRTEAADAWLIQVDGLTIARLDPEDVTADAGTYTWNDNGEVSPLRPHTLAVRGIEGNDRTEAAEVTQAHTVGGVWLLPTGDGVPVVLDGTSVEGFAATDSRATYEMADGSEHDIIYGHVPRRGEFQGTVGDHTLGGTWAAVDQIETWKLARSRRVRMVWGSQSELVRLRDPDSTSADDMLPNNELHVVRFSFIREN